MKSINKISHINKIKEKNHVIIILLNAKKKKILIEFDNHSCFKKTFQGGEQSNNRRDFLNVHKGCIFILFYF